MTSVTQCVILLVEIKTTSNKGEKMESRILNKEDFIEDITLRKPHTHMAQITLFGQTHPVLFHLYNGRFISEYCFIAIFRTGKKRHVANIYYFENPKVQGQYLLNTHYVEHNKHCYVSGWDIGKTEHNAHWYK